MSRPQEFDLQEVMAAAMAVYWERGVHYASVEDILKATGLARSSLYNSFGSKEELFEEVVRLYVDNQVARFERIAASRTFRSVLKRLFEGPVGDNFEGRGCLLANCAGGLLRDDADRQVMIREGFERIFAILEMRIGRAQEDGELHAALDPNAVAILICSTLSGMRLFRKTGMPSKKLRRAAVLAMDSLLLQFGTSSLPH